MATKASNLDSGLFILRVFPAFFMITHGWAKLVSFSEKSSSFPDPLGIGSTASLSATIGAEFFCAVMILLGIATRLVAIPITFTMLVAAFLVLQTQTFQAKELPLLYAAVFFTLIFTGGGKYALGSKFPKLRRFN